MHLKLYHYWRSSSSWRVRWALALKQIDCEFAAVNLLSDETDEPAHRHRNPMGYVPVLELLDEPEAATPQARAHRFLTESSAIIEWAEERFPKPSLLPQSPEQRAHIRRLCELINSGIQPLQNPNVTEAHSSDEAARKEWARNWIRKGMKAYNDWIQGSSGKFSFGDELTMADLFLIPQCYAALRFNIELESEFPVLATLYRNALETPSCQASHPDRFKPQ